MKNILFLEMLLFILMLGAWEYFGSSFGIIQRLISNPTKILDYWITNHDVLIKDLLHTLYIASIALVVAAIIAFLIGCLIILNEKLVNKIVRVSSVLQTIPAIVFVPFLVLLFGVGYVPKILIALVVIIFGLIIGVVNVLQWAKNTLHELMLLYRVPPIDILIKFLLPYSLPVLISHLRIAANYSILGAIIAEFSGSSAGIGQNIFLATVRLEPDLMVISVIMCFFLGTSVHYSMIYLEKKYSWMRNNGEKNL